MGGSPVNGESVWLRRLRGPAAALSALLLVLVLPRTGVADREARVAFLGDGGTGGWRQKAVRGQLLRHSPRFVFLLGDNVYDQGQAERIRERHDGIYGPVVAAGAEFHAALGNHDVEKCRVASADEDEAQVEALHHPIHSAYSEPSRAHARKALRAQLEPVLDRHDVDAVFAAHDHLYTRMAPGDGVRYFVSGGAGGRLYRVGRLSEEVAAARPFHHLIYVRATEGAFEYYAIDSEGRSRDAGWFAKGASIDAPFPPGTLPPR